MGSPVNAMRHPYKVPTLIPPASDAPLAARLICLRRSDDGRRIEKVGVEVGDVLKHYAPAGILFVLKLGAWRLRYVPPSGAALEVGVGLGADGEEQLHALTGNTLREDDGLSQVPLCTHRHHTGSFDAIG
jgi:hypothetical protein